MGILSKYQIFFTHVSHN